MWWFYGLLTVIILIGSYFVIAYTLFNLLFRRTLAIKPVYNLMKPLFGQHFQKHVPALRETQQFYKDLPGEEITIESNNINLKGIFYENKESNKIIIFVHGYYSNGSHDIGYVGKIHQDLGVSLLLIDQRGCDKSEGKYTSLGNFERFDVREWLFYLEKRFGDTKDLYLHGVSMGAATSIMVTGLNGLPKSFKGVIADCGFSGTKGVMLYAGKRLLRIRPKRLFWGVNFYARLYAGFNLKDANVTEELKKNQSIPILFIHGENDHFVPYSMSVTNYEAMPGENKKLVSFPNAEHCESYLTDSERYFTEVRDFINGK